MLLIFISILALLIIVIDNCPDHVAEGFMNLFMFLLSIPWHICLWIAIAAKKYTWEEYRYLYDEDLEYHAFFDDEEPCNSPPSSPSQQ
jgi:hypothetical protein